MTMREKLARAMHDSANKHLDRMIADGLASGMFTLDRVAEFRREIEFVKDFDAQVPEKKRDDQEEDSPCGHTRYTVLDIKFEDGSVYYPDRGKDDK